MYSAIQTEGKDTEVPKTTLHFVPPFSNAMAPSQRVKETSLRKKSIPRAPHCLGGD